MNKDPALITELSEENRIVLHDIGHILSLIQLRLFNLQQFYKNDDNTNNSLSDLNYLINRLVGIFHRLTGSTNSTDPAEEEFLIDMFLHQTSRTIGFCAGLDNHVKFDLRCPEAFVSVSSEDLLSAIVNIISNSRKAVKGQGNIIIKTRYYFDSLPSPEFIDLSIEDDGIWTRSVPIPQDSDNANRSYPRTRRGLKSIRKFADKNNINLRVDTGFDIGTSITLRIPITQRSSSSFDGKINTYMPIGNRRWNIYIFANNDEFQAEILQALNDESNQISIFSELDGFKKRISEYQSDIILIDGDIFDIKFEDLIDLFHRERGQLIVFTSKAPDPKSIHSSAIVMNKPIKSEILIRTIAAIKLIRLSN